MTDMLRQFALSVLDDENGISTDAWEKLLDLLHQQGEFEFIGELNALVGATDGRFYIK